MCYWTLSKLALTKYSRGTVILVRHPIRVCVCVWSSLKSVWLSW
jgi:hypothetical protein